MANFNIPKYNFKVPWFMMDLFNKQLITSPVVIPSSDITDTKDIVLAETLIPGLNFNPITPGGQGNKKLSFTISLIKRNNTVGNLTLLKQYDNLRNQATGLTNLFSPQFNPNPKVLFFWGAATGTPLEYYVKKCDFVHRSKFINQLGNPQFTDISFELWLDETSPLYKAEEVFRKVSSLAGLVQTGFDIAASLEGELTI